MTTKKNPKESKAEKKPSDPVAAWEKEVEEINGKVEKWNQVKAKAVGELRKFRGSLKAAQVDADNDYKQKVAGSVASKSVEGVFDDLYKIPLKTPKVTQLQENVDRVSSTVQLADTEIKKLEAEKRHLLDRIEEHAISRGIRAFHAKRKQFTEKYQELRQCFAEMVALSRANGDLDEQWIHRLNRNDVPEDLAVNKFDYQLMTIFEPRMLPQRTLLSVLERLRGFNDFYGPNPFMDAQPNIGKPERLQRDSFRDDGPMVGESPQLQQALERAIPSNMNW